MAKKLKKMADKALVGHALRSNALLEKGKLVIERQQQHIEALEELGLGVIDLLQAYGADKAAHWKQKLEAIMAVAKA